MKKSEKFTAIKMLRDVGLPVVPFEFLSQDDFEKQIKAFLKKNNLYRFMIRTGGQDSGEMASPSINNAELPRDMEKIRSFFTDGLVVMMMHPANPHRNLHNMNILKSGREVIVEIVGQGFIARDLNLWGHVHEELVFSLPNLELLERKIISPEKYQKAVQKKIEASDREELEKDRSYLLEGEDYLPATEEELDFLVKIFPNVQETAKKMGYEDFVANLSFVDLGGEKHEPVFWDIYGVK